jgi:hypothetical protein
VVGKKQYWCNIIGGYGRKPVDADVLSTESAAVVSKNGPCLTIAEVPEVDSGMVHYAIVKIFSQPVLADREKNVVTTSSDVAVRSHK